MVWSLTSAKEISKWFPPLKRAAASGEPSPRPPTAAAHGPQGQANCNKAAWRRSPAPGGYVWPKLSGKALRWCCPHTAVCVARCRWQAPAWGEALPAPGGGGRRWFWMVARQPHSRALHSPLAVPRGNAFKKGQKAATSEGGEVWKTALQALKWGKKEERGEVLQAPQQRSPCSLRRGPTPELRGISWRCDLFKLITIKLIVSERGETTKRLFLTTNQA